MRMGVKHNWGELAASMGFPDEIAMWQHCCGFVGLSHRQMANVLGCSASTIHTRVHALGMGSRNLTEPTRGELLEIIRVTQRIPAGAKRAALVRDVKRARARQL